MFCVVFRTKFLGHKGFLLNLENIFYALLHQKIGIFCGTKNYMRATVVTNPLKQTYICTGIHPSNNVTLKRFLEEVKRVITTPRNISEDCEYNADF